MFDLQQRWYGIENLDRDGNLHEQMYVSGTSYTKRTI